MDDFNPYAAPKAYVSPQLVLRGIEEGRGVWSDGKTLVMVKVARLPNRCVKCNEPGTSLVKRSFYWHHPAYYLLILFPGPLIFVILAMIIRSTAKIFVPLCEEHRAKRSKAILTAWVFALAGIALCFAPAFRDGMAILPSIGVLMILFGLLFGSYQSQILTPEKIDTTHVWLKRVGPAYLASLPPLPGSEEPDPRRIKPSADYDIEL